MPAMNLLIINPGYLSYRCQQYACKRPYYVKRQQCNFGTASGSRIVR
jgi:hypothetical protein